MPKAEFTEPGSVYFRISENLVHCITISTYNELNISFNFFQPIHECYVLSNFSLHKLSFYDLQ